MSLLASYPISIPFFTSERWTPVILRDRDGSGEPRTRRGALAPDGRVALDDGSIFTPHRDDVVEADLTSKTGRVHAAWWVRDYSTKNSDVWRAISGEDWHLIGAAEVGAPLTPEQIDLLARLVLRLAGVTR